MAIDNKHDLYLFVPPSSHVLPEISRHVLTPGLVETPVAANRLHMTIAALGRFPATPYPLIAYLNQLLSNATLPSFGAILDMLVGGQKSALLQPSERLPGFEALQAHLAGLLRDALAFVGIDPALWRRHIRPHVTLGYRGRPTPAQPIDPISWMADRLLLVESLHGKGRHIVHGSWPLTKVRQLGFEFDEE